MDRIMMARMAALRVQFERAETCERKLEIAERIMSIQSKQIEYLLLLLDSEKLRDQPIPKTE